MDGWGGTSIFGNIHMEKHMLLFGSKVIMENFTGYPTGCHPCKYFKALLRDYENHHHPRISGLQ